MHLIKAANASRFWEFFGSPLGGLITQLNINPLTKRLIRIVHFIYGHLMAHYRIRHMAHGTRHPAHGSLDSWQLARLIIGFVTGALAVLVINRGLLEMQIRCWMPPAAVWGSCMSSVCLCVCWGCVFIWNIIGKASKCQGANVRQPN